MGTEIIILITADWTVQQYLKNAFHYTSKYGGMPLHLVTQHHIFFPQIIHLNSSLTIALVQC